MAECPKCNKDIKYLVIVSKGTAIAEWSPEDGYDVTNVSMANESWRCPGCDEELFKTEEEAKKFFEEVDNAEVPKV